MKYVLCSAAVALLCMPTMADVITYGEVEYQTIDWISTPEAGSSVSGVVDGVGVTFSSVSISGEAPVINNFSGAPAFDALSFETGLAESISVFGGLEGLSRLTFSRAVGPVLIMIGSTTDHSTPTHYGSAVWDFDNDLEMGVIDGDGAGFSLDEGNIVSNPEWGPESQICGVVGVFEGEMTLLEWMQGTENGVDKMQITFAVSVPPIPAPASGLALLLPAAMFGRRRR